MIAIVGLIASGLVLSYFLGRWIPNAVVGVLLGALLASSAVLSGLVMVVGRAGMPQNETELIAIMPILVLTTVGAVIGRWLADLQARRAPKSSSRDVHSPA